MNSEYLSLESVPAPVSVSTSHRRSVAEAQSLLSEYGDLRTRIQNEINDAFQAEWHDCNVLIVTLNEDEYTISVCFSVGTRFNMGRFAEIITELGFKSGNIEGNSHKTGGVYFNLSLVK